MSVVLLFQLYTHSKQMLQITSLTQSQAVSSVLDLCCGSGVQGIVALRYYAQSASFVAGELSGWVWLTWYGLEEAGMM